MTPSAPPRLLILETSGRSGCVAVALGATATVAMPWLGSVAL